MIVGLGLPGNSVTSKVLRTFVSGKNKGLPQLLYYRSKGPKVINRSNTNKLQKKELFS